MRRERRSGMVWMVWMLLLGSLSGCLGVDNTALPLLDDTQPPETQTPDPVTPSSPSPSPTNEDFDQDGYTALEDCNDTNSTIHPDAEERCDGIDNNCSGTADEGLELVTYYQDVDLDGYASANNETVVSCTAPAGYSSSVGDCDDSNPDVAPNLAERCDGIDNDCDHSTDEGLEYFSVYTDADGDGVGTSQAGAIPACAVEPGYSLQNDDCNDTDASTYPSAPELCDRKDNDCDGGVDEGLPLLNIWPDADGDGFGASGSTPSQDCGATPGYSLLQDDCDDTVPSIHPTLVSWTRGSSSGTGSYSQPLKSIQSALYTAGCGLVLAEPGNYFETVSATGISNVTLRSTAGPDSTVWKSTDAGRALTLRSALNFTLEGFTISSTSTTEVVGDGGCVAVETSSAIHFTNLRFSDCHIENEYDYGGAASFALSEDVLVDNSEFRDNFSYYGGALASNISNVTVTDSSFENNIGDAYGGAVIVGDNISDEFVGDPGILTIIRCTFVGNQAEEGGAGYGFTSHKLNVEDSYFEANLATNTNDSGSGLDPGNGGALYNPSYVLRSEFVSNSGNWGGAIYLLSGTDIISSIFWKNSCNYGGGAIFVDDGTLENHFFNIVNSTFVNNLSSILDAYGGDAFYIYDAGGFNVRNNIVYSSLTESQSSLIQSAEVTDAPVFAYNDFYAFNSKIKSGLSFAWGVNVWENNLESDPDFVGTPAGDSYSREALRLSSGSPCIDTGDPTLFDDPEQLSRSDMGAFGGPEGFQTLD